MKQDIYFIEQMIGAPILCPFDIEKLNKPVGYPFSGMEWKPVYTANGLKLMAIDIWDTI